MLGKVRGFVGLTLVPVIVQKQQGVKKPQGRPVDAGSGVPVNSNMIRQWCVSTMCFVHPKKSNEGEEKGL